MSGQSRKKAVVIDRHICGLPGVGFGGYVGGLLATELGTPAKVDFLQPAPLDVPLSVEHDPSVGEAKLLNGDIVLAVGRAHETSDAHPAPPPWEEAVRASATHMAMLGSEYPNCFGCGPAVHEGEGMWVFAGPISERGLVAAAWVPSNSFAGADGAVLSVYVWSALDCPGGLARRQLLSSEPAVTAYLAVQQWEPVLAGNSHVVIGCLVRNTGRKSFVGMAIFDQGGRLCASSEALWINSVH